jgi:hypothetical protein
MLSLCLFSWPNVESPPGHSINLVSACKNAGFRHVVGTNRVSGQHHIDAGKVLYNLIRDKGITDDAIYMGYHRAARRFGT